MAEASAPIRRFLEQRVALVTGSTSGIGASIARSLAACGCDIILSGFGEQEVIKSFQDELISKYSVKVDYIHEDLRKPASDIEQFYLRIKQSYPNGIDILVNNAGLQHVCNVEDFFVADWDEIIAVMLSSPFHLIRLALPDMRRKGWGRIINICSVQGVIASPFKSAYVAAKHGLVGLTKAVALEAAGSGVTCNAISPGFVDTQIFRTQVQALADSQKLQYGEAKEKFLEKYHPSKEALSVEHIAAMCTFLSGDAACQMTGSNTIMDGGYTAR